MIEISTLFKQLNRQTALESIQREAAIAEPAIPYTALCDKSANECSEKQCGTCNKIHFDAIVASNTDVSLGDCSYLNTCFKGKNCRYVHYHISLPDKVQKKIQEQSKFDTFIYPCEGVIHRKELTMQWINIDVRKLEFSALGQFAIVIADLAPWDIHTNTISHTPHIHEATSDEDMLQFHMECLQTEGVFFLWVTGRAIDIGRKCLRKWGYKHIEELIWCKTNQLSRTICTGRTGHWLNHSKEHVLMGRVKGNPQWLARRLDVDVIVSGTREKSHKPDELYHIAERMAGKHSRKLELFGGLRNLRPGWLTIGNELGSTHLVEPALVEKFGGTA
ncbi:uncharacterized protein SAPINGB_P004390 [Magnusiomyces paraingens]|uniref:mRNA m(6)A methyltransferase n=1 Tax=Magnusiomyces paraingens TaxID=2606893 RepID=A0A5E8BZM5_9ASCO|nr:uncharacterized protein SAPINGB_P004390 [Saprochaete ingens]VVT55037.1 unnamed protein product [Saprochaete ingens]